MTNLEYARIFLEEKFGNEVKTVETVDAKICINGLLAFPILVSSFYDRTSPYKIVNESNDPIGEIIFTKSERQVEISSLPLNKCICLLEDFSGELISETTYLFNTDFLLLKFSSLDDYERELKSTSPIWGGYFHKENLLNTAFSKQKKVVKVVATTNISIDRPFYLETLEVAFKETNPFVRFLKLYHLLELKFDIHTAEKLKEYLDLGNKEKEISRTLKDYTREDIERLQSLFSLNVNPSKLLPYIEEIRNYTAIADSLFYVYGKSSNPLKEKNRFDELIRTGFSESNINKVVGNRLFNNFVPKLVAYWIYRIRSSIAHNKLGEYLMTSADEEFITEFAEPLLNEIIIHCYKR